MSKALIVVAVIMLSMFSPYIVSDARESLSASDPAGDVYIFNAGADEAAGVDIVAVSIVYDSENEVLIYTLEVAGSLGDSGVYAYDVVFEVDQVVRYEAVIVVTDGTVSLTYFILEGHPLGVLNIDKLNVTIEESVIEVKIPLSSEFSPFNTDVLGDAAEYWIIADTRYNSNTGGAAGDEMMVLVSREDAAETITYTATETPTQTDGMETPSNDTVQVFKDMNVKASGVDVSITETPMVKFMLVESNNVPGLKIAVMEITVEGTSKGASHVAVAIEAFVGEELLSQYIVNSATMGQHDLDGVENGYQIAFKPPQPQGAEVAEIREELVPVDGWDTWRFTASYRIPVGPETVSELQFIKFIEEMEKRNVEVYITAIAFSGLDENQYTTATKKADISYSLEGNTGTSPTTAYREQAMTATTVSPVNTAKDRAGVVAPGAVSGDTRSPVTTTTTESTPSGVGEEDDGFPTVIVVIAVVIAIVTVGAVFLVFKR